MKRSLKSLIGYTMGATDGEIGKVKEVYFDDISWTIRYLIVETGNWLSGRQVLISPVSLLATDWEKGSIPVNLTKEQVRNSPDIDTELPVSRQQEMKLYEHYNLGSYWGGSFYGGGMPLLSDQEIQQEEKHTSGDETAGDPHLRSTEKVTGYNIEATDDVIGNVEDFIIDDSTWEIDFMVVDTGNWLPGKKILISPKWIKKIDWATDTVIVNVSVERVKNSPEYNPAEPISDTYELTLHKYYARFVIV